MVDAGVGEVAAGAGVGQPQELDVLPARGLVEQLDLGARRARRRVERDVVEVVIRESTEQTMTLLFDPELNLEERILKEQFTV